MRGTIATVRARHPDNPVSDNLDDIALFKM